VSVIAPGVLVFDGHEGGLSVYALMNAGDALIFFVRAFIDGVYALTDDEYALIFVVYELRFIVYALILHDYALMFHVYALIFIVYEGIFVVHEGIFYVYESGHDIPEGDFEVFRLFRLKTLQWPFSSDTEPSALFRDCLTAAQLLPFAHLPERLLVRMMPPA
jgi:hypothetical protein